jgi:hypothetical protein
MRPNTYEIDLGEGDRLVFEVVLADDPKESAAQVLYWTARGNAAQWSLQLTLPQLTALLKQLPEAVEWAMLELGHMPPDEELPG